MERWQLIRIYNEVEADIINGFYVNSRDEEIEFKKVGSLKSGSKIYRGTTKIPEADRPKFLRTKIYAENIDTFDKVLQFGSDGVCLNMASNRNPGGGVVNGARAQEECLCRRSNLIYSLQAFAPKSDFGFIKKNQEASYPLPLFGGIYSPCVNVYKDKNYINYDDDPKLTNVISVAAVNHPKLTEDGRIEKSYIGMIKNKIRTILRIAILNGHTKLVLGAFGCGAYANPAQHTAEIFHSVLSEDEFVHSFSEICFAILEDNNSMRKDNKEGNYKPFARVFGENK